MNEKPEHTPETGDFTLISHYSEIELNEAVNEALTNALVEGSSSLDPSTIRELYKDNLQDRKEERASRDAIVNRKLDIEEKKLELTDKVLTGNRTDRNIWTAVLLAVACFFIVFSVYLDNSAIGYLGSAILGHLLGPLYRLAQSASGHKSGPPAE